MDKYHALHQFWSQFGVEAYDENTIPDDAALPYITYSVSVGSFDYPTAISASIYDRSTKWTSVTQIADRVGAVLKNGGQYINYDGGAFWIRMGSPWMQRLSDNSNEDIRRIVLNLEIEYVE